MNKQLKIGILGTRGIPNRYGGFEQCAEYLALGLTKKGHHVSVYNAHNHEYQASMWNGINIIHCKDPEHKMGTFGQFIYDYNCIQDARKRKFDILLQLGYTSNSIWHKIWPRDCKNIVNMDGLEWKRSKYNKHVQRFLKYAEKLAAMNADALVADSIGIQEYLRSAYQKESAFIPYGAEVFDAPDDKIIRDLTLAPFGYNLVIARMEPENNIEMIIEGVISASQDKPLVIIGKTENTYGKYLAEKYTAQPNVKFLGGIYDVSVINNLRYFSLLYFHGHTVGGTNPSLLEAMACNSLIAAHNNVFNRTVLGEDGFYFDSSEQIMDLVENINNKYIYEEKLARNRAKIKEHYNWLAITNEYEQIFFAALGK